MIPPGVQDSKPGRPRAIDAKDLEVTPSTSFAGAMASKVAVRRPVPGRGAAQDPVHGAVRRELLDGSDRLGRRRDRR
jgi:hypothetical protein